MKKNNTNINSDLSKKDFESYFKGNMNDEEKSKFLSDSENNEFENEALKGFALFPDGINDIPEIDKSIKTNFGNNISITRKYFYIATPIVIVSLMVLLYFLNESSKNTINKKSNLVENNLNTLKIDTHKINNINKEIENAIVNSESEQINSIKAKTDQKSVTDFEKIKPLETISNVKVSSIKNENDSSGNKLFTAFIHMITDYMYDFKVIDYSKIYNNKIKTDIFETGSISAKFENKLNNTDDNSNNLSANYVRYKDFLSETMGKLSANSYKNALQDYIIIIQHFPKDQNANFYGGLCYYNLGLFEKAIEFFDVIIESNVAVFYQEAKWYKANSLLNSNKIKEAKKEFKEIVSIKGFYAERAIEKLSQIDK